MAGHTRGGAWRIGLAMAVVLPGLIAAKCNPVSDLPCSTTETCVEIAEGGVCEPEGFCTFPDLECPNMKRWHDRAPDSLAGTCWEPNVAGGTDTDTGATDTDSATGDTDPTTTTSSGTTTGTTSTSTTTTTTTDSSTSGTSDGGSSTGAAAMTCDEQYGGATDYMFCAETADSCSFNVTIAMAASCNDVCGMFGGTCVGAELNDVDLCTMTGAGTCDQMDVGDLICICSR